MSAQLLPKGLWLQGAEKCWAFWALKSLHTPRKQAQLTGKEPHGSFLSGR